MDMNIKLARIIGGRRSNIEALISGRKHSSLVQKCLLTLETADVIIGLVTNVLTVTTADYTFRLPGKRRSLIYRLLFDTTIYK